MQEVGMVVEGGGEVMQESRLTKGQYEEVV